MIPESNESRIGIFQNCVRSIVENRPDAMTAKRRIDAINLLWASSFDAHGNGPVLTYEGEPCGVFTIVGYKVGNKSFSTNKRRPSNDDHELRPYLVYLIDGTLPHIRSDAYMAQWGKAGSQQRVETIARNIKNLAASKRHLPSMSLAVSHWDADVEYLRQRWKTASPVTAS